MASVQTSSYDGRYLKLTVVEESYNVATNISTVRWTLESIGGASATYYTIYNWGVWVNGQTIYAQQTTGWSSYQFPAGTGSRTGTIQVAHSADGSIGNIGFTLKGCVYYNRDNTYNGSLALTQGNRNTNVYQSLNSKTPNSITMNWSTSNTVNYLWYSINGGSSWTAIGGVNASSGTYTISGLSPDTSYSIRTRARRADTGLDNNYSGTTSIATYKAYSVVSSVSVGDILPFTCTAYCTSSNASNTNEYEYSICDSNKSVLATYSSNVTTYPVSGLNEETGYYIRCRVKSTDSGHWSDYIYSSLFETPADQSKGYIKINGQWTLGKVYIKINGEWVKAKKTYIKNNNWIISKNP